MRIAIAQINSVIGDFAGNADKVLAFAERARKNFGAELVVFPELCLSGYPPMDLLDQDSFAEGNLRALRSLQKRLPADLAVGVGYVGRNPGMSGKALVNSYGILSGGELAFTQDKTLLPSYDVFDEARYFESATERRIFRWKGEKIGIAICEDLWWDVEPTPGSRYAIDPVRDLEDLGATLLVVPSASPYYANKEKIRHGLAARIVRRNGAPIIYVNAVGANDSLVFDGRSFIMAEDGVAAGASFGEDILAWETTAPLSTIEREKPAEAPAASELDVIEKALVLGLRDYMKKCGFKRAHLGLSGGIDSALIAVLAVEAIGAENVACFGLPSRFSSDGSKDDARELAENLGIRFDIIPIEKSFTAFLDTLAPIFEGRPFDLAEENLQARIRGTLLMAWSNKFDSMLLTTGNKSELAMGYCTLYGDMDGALSPIGDLFKTEVFALCERINEKSRAATGKNLIPEAILTKPPSAELRPNQKDQDSLPPYEVLDAVLALHLLEGLSKDEIVARGWDEALAARVIKGVARAEFKRRQASPVIKVSTRAFGMGRRMPIARIVHDA